MCIILWILCEFVDSKCVDSGKISSVVNISPLVPENYTIIQATSTENHFEHILLAKYSTYPQVSYNNTSEQWISDEDFSTINSWVCRTDSSDIIINPTKLTSEKLYFSLFLCESLELGSINLKVSYQTFPYCPNSCNEHGICSNKGCNCNEGYIGQDCNLSITQFPLNEILAIKLPKNSWNVYFLPIKDHNNLTISVKNITSEDMFIFFKYTDIIQDIPSIANFDENYHIHINNQYNFTNSLAYLLLSVFCDSSIECYVELEGKELISSSSYEDNNTIIGVSCAAGLAGIIVIFLISCKIYKLCIRWSHEKQAKRIANDVIISYPEAPWSQRTDIATCSICFEDFNPGSMTRSFHCGHSFHSECIDRWLAYKTSCPSCKRNLLNE
ncbi:hypothetical protein SteCoe_17972 [Stentor coeruleus]|uniref:RING-type domain-containing protein n=1 Tax=Stentor coeruleus TaxID=5963 RepID=A0A1R2BXN6_9CILI|nr:hypothetical protein SteCoe_17972 [Stentor coeruleus]